MFINNYDVDSDTITSMVLKSLNENAMPFQLKNLQLEQDKIFLDSSTLITFNNFECVKDFNQKLILNNEYFKPLQLFVFCQNVTIKEIESLKVDVTERAKKNKITEIASPDILLPRETTDFNSYLLDIIQYEYFLVDETNYIKLLTFLWFSPGKCGALELIELIKFNKITQKWKNNQFSMKKSLNLHGCIIVEADGPTDVKIVSQLDHEVSAYLKGLLNATMVKRFGELSIDILFSKGCFNAVDRHRYTHDNDKSGKEFDNLNFITFPLEYINSRVRTFDETEYYSEYDKLSMPFDNFTWAMIALTFVVAFTTILILHCCVKKSTRELIIGSNVASPSLNVIRTFFGISQAVLPWRNFARFLTMVFILYCLIIRTAWQGKMYEFMQKDIEKPQRVYTINELIENDYIFTMEENYKEKYSESEISKGGKIVSLLRDTGKYEDEKLWANQINACWVHLMHLELQKYLLKTTIKQDLHLTTCGLKFPRHHHLFEGIDDKLQQLLIHGILMHPVFGRSCGSLPWPELNEKRFRTYEDPKVLSLKILEPGFVIWTSSLLLAVAAFILEWLMTLRNYLIMKYILRGICFMKH